MRQGRLFRGIALALACAPAAPALAQPASVDPAANPEARYALAGGCFALRSQAAGRYVAKAGEGYRASATDRARAEPFRMQATALGQYLFYGPSRDFLAGRGRSEIEAAAGASNQADWEISPRGTEFVVALHELGSRGLAVDSADGDLILQPGTPDGPGALFTFERTDGCAEYPEVEVNVTGTPSPGASPFSQARGYVDAHMHMMAYEFLGGRAHCGRPWHRWGAPYALVDCPDHEPGGAGAVLENFVSSGGTRPTHDTVGWPTFRDWPRHNSLTHEQSYYRWLERSWRAGQRVFVNLLVDNAALCELYPYKQNSCNEMHGVRLQARRIRELENYIDAQWGGPGKGWFRIVTDPFQARRVINEGKLAVVMGIEISELFDCGLQGDIPQCDRAQIDSNLAEVHALGVRQMELINKFDNALGGVAGDSGTFGLAVNYGNFQQTGHFWQFQTCDGPEEAHDRNQITTPLTSQDQIFGAILNQFGGVVGQAPLTYPNPPHCNTRGLTPLGEHLVRRMMERGMIIDPDHLSVRARNQLLSVVESERYSGIVSSHSWSTPDSFPRIYALGGFITPYAGGSAGFAEEWERNRAVRDEDFYFGFGFGADANGFGNQGGPRSGNAENPVRYPFRSFDGAVTIDRQRSGRQVYDINEDGVAHYGLYPDWIEDLRMIKGDAIVEDMARGAEAYLQMWERAVGVPRGCRAARGSFTRRGLGDVRLADTAARLLERAGQPEERGERVWRWCVSGRAGRGREVTAVLTTRNRVGLVASDAASHRAARAGRGRLAERIRGARPFGRGVLVRPAGGGARFVYGVRRGRVSFVAVASRQASSSPRRLRAYLRLAGLR